MSGVAEQLPTQDECPSCALLECPCWRHDPLCAGPLMRRAAALGSIQGTLVMARAALVAGDVAKCRQALEQALADCRLPEEEAQS